MNTPGAALPLSPEKTPGSDHFVQFYETSQFLVSSVCDHVGDGFAKGEGAILIAKPDHLAACEEQLILNGFNLASLRERGFYVALDAAQTLSRFMVDGIPQPALFDKTVGAQVARLARLRKGIRAFGEMVALLWAEGNQAGAVQLEHLWNDLAKRYSFSLLCAYPLAAFDGANHTVPMQHVCNAHTRVLPGESFCLEHRPETRLTQIALLQQKARSLELEIEERKRCEEQIRRRERELADLLENAAEGIHQVAIDGTILWANRAEFEMLGYRPEEYIGRRIADFHADEKVSQDILARLRRGESLHDYEATLIHKDGSLRYVAINSNVCWEGGRFTYSRCFTRDITDRKRTAEALERMVAERTVQLRETNAQLEAFSYSISHDLRSPLRTMQSYAVALLEDYSSSLPPEGVEFLKRIQKGSARLDQLIRDLLAFSKVTNGEVQLRPVALEPLLENLLQQHPGFENVRHSILVQSPLHAVVGHEAYLTQCLTNLIENALKFVPPGTTPQVRIQAEVLDQKVKLSITDNGIGIDPEYAPRLFQIFGRVHAGNHYPGTGIGLAIVKKAIDRMNGQVGFVSTPGQGSSFWLLLPQAPSPLS